MKTCTKCKIKKPLDRFTKDSRRADGAGSWCKVCHNERHWVNREENNAKCKAHYAANKAKYKNYHRLKSYGVSQEQYDSMFENQKGCCAICNQTLDQSKNTCVDHCHKTGKVRGLLCANCNFGIGHLKDSIPLIESAIQYLKGHQ